MRTLLLALTLLLAPLAGCIAESEDPLTLSVQRAEREQQQEEERLANPVVEVDERRAIGSIEGRILDDELRPIAGAEVELLGINVTAKTTSAGDFRFGRVNAGDYVLVIRHPAFFQAQVGVQVIADEASRVDITLEGIPSPEPRTEQVTFRIYLSCRAFVLTPVGTTNLNTKGTCVSDPGVEFEYQRWADLETKPGLAGSLFEISWEATTDLGRTLAAGTNPRGNGGSTDQYWSTAGQDALAVIVTLADLREATASGVTNINYEQTGNLMSYNVDVVPDYTGLAVDVGLAVNQLVDAQVTMFYVDEPADYDQYRLLTEA